MTHLVVCGLNYHSSPIAIRERFTIPESCLGHALKALSHLPHVKEAAVLSTCNRTEVYAVVTNVEAGFRELDAFFASVQQVGDHGALNPNFKLLREDVAVHLFRVAAGLDSMVLGEGQIMAQVKAAHQTALEAGMAGPVLDCLFKMALSCGKRVRSETSMGRRAVSVSSAAVELARSVAGELKHQSIAVIGAGKMAQIVVKLLLQEPGEGTIYLLNRSKERVDNLLKNKLNNTYRLATDFGFDERHKVAATADLVIISTSAPGYLLVKEELRANRSKDKPLCVIDISVPRNADPSMAELEGVKVFHADDLAQIVTRNLQEREALVEEAEHIVFETLDEFHGWQRSLLVVPTIAELREKIEAIRQEHMAKSCPQGESHHLEANKLEQISAAIVNQILHHPTVQLKATRDYGILKQQAEALRTLFNLDPLDQKSRSTRSRKKPAAAGHDQCTSTKAEDRTHKKGNQAHISLTRSPS